MKIYTGVDICEIERIEKSYEKYGKKFLNKIYTKSEINYCLKNPKKTAERLAVRFAAKEAVSKALEVGINKIGWNKGVNWQDIEVVKNSSGSLNLKLVDKAELIQNKKNIKNWTVSVSHSKNDAIAFVIGYE